MSGEPPFRYVFRLTDGETLICAPNEARRYINRRRGLQPEVVWEICDYSKNAGEEGHVRDLWPDQIVSWTQEELVPVKELRMEEAE